MKSGNRVVQARKEWYKSEEEAKTRRFGGRLWSWIIASFNMTYGETFAMM